MRTRSRSRSMIVAGAAGLAMALGFASSSMPAGAEEARLVPPPKHDARETGDTATAVLAGGCFWGVQGVFQHVKGVKSAVSGYAGGSKMTAFYPVVSSGTTGHAESVKVTYDPREVTYGKLLQIYFSVVADPTTLNAQGPDEGTQYRSDLFAMSSDQAKVAKDYIAQLTQGHAFNRPIVTKVSDYKGFYPAEAYHQNYLTLHPEQPYIAYNDIPKVEGLKKLFPDVYTGKPVLVSSR